MEYWQRLRKIRRERNVTQAELARAIGMSQGTYSRIENGKVELMADKLMGLCRFYNLSADYLIGITDEESAPSFQKE